MKFLGLAATAVLASSATARSVWTSSSAVTPFDDKVPTVPGKNPLEYCEDPKDNILEVKRVDLDPNPPKAGQTLTFTADGNLGETIEAGAYASVQVKYGLITILRKEFDLCDTLASIDKPCPLSKGELNVTKGVDLPSQIPPGKYNVIADVYTGDGDKITCMTASVEFHVGGKGIAGGLFKQGL